MNRRLGLALTAALLLGSAAAPVLAAPPANIAAALADAGRSPEDKARDAARKPGELLEWIGVKPGDKVADLVMGGGYFTRILSAAVGPKGHVYAFQPSEFVGFQASYGASQDKVAAGYANVTPLRTTFGALDLPDGLDLVLTVQNYHDFHLKAFAPDTAAKVNAEVFKSLRSGGLYVIVDHMAAPGAAADAPQTVHRIDPAVVRKEVEAAGFKLVAETDLLKAPADPHTANVFDASIRGKTDQFTMKFRKP